MTDRNNATLADLYDSDRDILFVQASRHSDTAAGYAMQGKLAVANKLLSLVKGMLAIVGKADRDAWAGYYRARGAVAQAEGKFGSALALARKSLVINRRIYPQNHYYVIIAESKVGEALGDLGRNDQARKIMQACIKKLTALEVTTDGMIRWKDETLKGYAANLAKYG